MILPFETSALTSTLQQLDVKPEVIDKIVSTLTDESSQMDNGDFSTLAALGHQDFGSRDTAHQLAMHHQKAHSVMQQAIDGIVKDLTSFAAGAKTAIAYIDHADSDSAASLSQARQAVEQLHDVAANSQGNAGYDQGRNGQDAPPTTPSSQNQGG